jgi:hypothetical protein
MWWYRGSGQACLPMLVQTTGREAGAGGLAGSGGAGVIGWFPLSNPTRRGAGAVERGCGARPEPEAPI